MKAFVVHLKIWLITLGLVKLYVIVLLGILRYGWSDELYQFHEHLKMVMFIFPFYFGLSLLGWVLIGFPVHALVERFTAGSWAWYMGVTALVCCALILSELVNAEFIAVFFCVPIVLQAIAFKFIYEKYRSGSLTA